MHCAFVQHPFVSSDAKTVVDNTSVQKTEVDNASER